MELQAADAYCRYLARRHYENFSVASIVLPPELRLHLARIYAYCRTTDDLGDESGDGAAARLLHWREQVERCFEDLPAPVHPVLLSLSRTIATFGLPPDPFLDLIDANLQDQVVSRYERWDELRQYCTLSAAPVGRLVLKVFGVHDPAAERLSDDVCIGLQLANFAQDVSLDWAKGRTYLLQSELHSHGQEGAVRLTCQRAATLLSSGRELERLVPLRLRVQLALYRLGGAAILSAIRDLDYCTAAQRPQVSFLVKAKLVPQAWLQSRRSTTYAQTQHVA